LNCRETGQGTSSEIRNRDLRKELEDRETSSKSSSSKQATVVRRALEANAKRQKLEQNPDADDAIDSDNSDDSDDSEDDTAALMEELNKIKRERAQENAKKEHEKQQEEERIRMENIICGNPLLNFSTAPKGNVKIKRRWNDDVVFKNCARTEVDKGETFINDSIRSEFHKKFMEKYIH
jgi:protein CWC15